MGIDRIPFDDAAYDRLARADCFVCRIVMGDPLIPHPRVVYEDESVIAFLNQLPTQEGYTLVCPKRHVERFESELSLEEWAHLQGVVHHIARAIARSTGAMRVYLASFGSPERNEHVHIHICPCPPGTPLDRQQYAAIDIAAGGWLDLPAERMEVIAMAIRDELARSAR